MGDPFVGKWNNLDESKYLDETRVRTQVIWLGRPIVIIVQGCQIVSGLSNDDLIPLLRISGMETKSHLISSYGDWDVFAKSSHVVWYKDGKDWKDPTAQNYTLDELAKEK